MLEDWEKRTSNILMILLLFYFMRIEMTVWWSASWDWNISAITGGSAAEFFSQASQRITFNLLHEPQAFPLMGSKMFFWWWLLEKLYIYTSNIHKFFLWCYPFHQARSLSQPFVVSHTWLCETSIMTNTHKPQLHFEFSASLQRLAC